ncbi:hypothetical protein KNP414_02126 [Paenibacillus mucilaginosus KNP414]|uniref:Uncharacterized protein n=1 Tax=Paenibacillus mucilaginosus (strain KNP414) TaxID=1036673 RepID=F8F4V7_PAEMK|nr:hypothetical protein KNP414_02126 [Paenibacillus mucilaginosus KNP414]
MPLKKTIRLTVRRRSAGGQQQDRCSAGQIDPGKGKFTAGKLRQEWNAASHLW